MASVPYWLEWLPFVLLVIAACVWIAGCTITTSSASQTKNYAAGTATPYTTLTVRPPLTLTPTPTIPPAPRIAVQPTNPPDPIIYQVQENDTLLDIAFEFGVSVEEILIANPGIDPLALQIGQEIVISEADTVRFSGDPHLPPPPPLPIIAPRCQRTTTESLVCMGLVENDQNLIITGIQVSVQVIEITGEVLSEQVTTLEQKFLFPGDFAPFRVLISQADEANMGGIVAQVVAGNPVEMPDARVVPLAIQNVSTAVEGRLYVLSADIENATDTLAAPPRVVVTLVDEGGNVYGYRVWDADAPIAPDGVLTVEIAILPTGLNGAPPTNLRHLLHVEAVPAE